MIIPMLLKIDFASLWKVRSYWRGSGVKAGVPGVRLHSALELNIRMRLSPNN
jgi:hypothetical protein